MQPEEIAHINSINWFCYEFKELADDMHHFANERYLDVKKHPELWVVAKKLGKMGVKRGVFDFFLALPLNGKAGFWIELKVGKNKLGLDQIAFMNRKMSRGYECKAVWGEDEFKDAILCYLKDYIPTR
jgi:hypothetical protein